MTNKDLLFYSNYCDFSKEIVTLITKRNLRGLVLLICIDTGKYQVPPCIQCVPSLFTADRDRVFTDNDLIQYLEEKAKTLYPQEDSLQTFSWEGNNYSESFSFVNDDMNGNMTTKAYTLLDDHHAVTANKLKDDDDVMKQNKFDIARYDNFIASRNKDVEQIKKSLHGNPVDRI